MPATEVTMAVGGIMLLFKKEEYLKKNAVLTAYNMYKNSRPEDFTTISRAIEILHKAADLFMDEVKYNLYCDEGLSINALVNRDSSIELRQLAQKMTRGEIVTLKEVAACSRLYNGLLDRRNTFSRRFNKDLSYKNVQLGTVI